MTRKKLEILLELLHDTLPLPDWQPEPHAAEDLRQANVSSARVRTWVALKNQHNWEMTVSLHRDRRS